MAKKKYIIELKEGKQFFVLSDTGMISVGSPEALFEEKNEDMLRPLGIIRAQPYTEPDTEQVRKEAYEKGVQDTKQHWVDFPRTCEYKLGYENGLNDAWEAAKKIGSNSMCSLKEMGFDFSQCVVSDYDPSWFVVKNYSAAEAIEKIQQYEEKERKEGSWIMSEVNEPSVDTTLICSKCGYTITIKPQETPALNFCQKCGDNKNPKGLKNVKL